MITLLGFIVLGLVSGAVSGLVGIGGGTIIVPALIFIFGLSQQQAQGTTLALLIPPIGILAAWSYYQQGYVDLKIASLICVGFLIGGLIGGRFATQLPTQMLAKIFGVFLVIIGIKMVIAR